MAKAETEGFKKRIKELEDFLKEANQELTEYDESMVRRYIEKIQVYEDKFTVCFKAGVDLDIERYETDYSGRFSGLSLFVVSGHFLWMD